MVAKKPTSKTSAKKKPVAKKSAPKKTPAAKKATGAVSVAPKQEATIVYANDVKQKSLRDRVLAWFKS
jgi:hypothetical protein